jgi:uncharacterized protein with HEPN domain
MSLSAREYAQHIRDETSYLLQASKGLTQRSFTADETLKRACVRSLEIIGEAVKKLPAEFKASYPQIEWRSIAGMRDRLIHAYFGVDYELVWDVLVNKIPVLHETITACLRDMTE